MSKEDH